MSPRVLFFDAAGTLFQPSEPVGTTYARVAGLHGIKVDGEVLMQSFRAAWKALPPPEHPPGMPPRDDDRGWWRRLVVEVFRDALSKPLTESAVDPFFDELYEHFAQPSAWQVYDDVKPALEDLARDHRMLVLSNFDRRLIRILEGHDLLRFFERVIISSEVGASKPHPRMFQAALAAATCSPEDCVHIGDDLRCDGLGARQFGIGYFQVDRPVNDLSVLVEKVRAGAYSGLRGPS